MAVRRDGTALDLPGPCRGRHASGPFCLFDPHGLIARIHTGQCHQKMPVRTPRIHGKRHRVLPVSATLAGADDDLHRLDVKMLMAENGS